MKGRSGDLFFRGLATEPIEQQIAIAQRLCFSGVYIDRRGYADRGVAIESQLQRLLGSPPTLVSASKQQIFFKLNAEKQAACALPQDVTPEQIMEREDLNIDESGVRYHATLSDGIVFSRDSLPDFLKKLDGLSGVEPWGRWSDASVNPTVRLRFAQPLPAHFVLHMRVQGFGPNVGRPAQVTIGNETQTFSPTAEPADYALSFNSQSGTNLIEIKPAKPTSPHDLGISGDGRKLGLGMERLWIEGPR